MRAALWAAEAPGQGKTDRGSGPELLGTECILVIPGLCEFVPPLLPPSLSSLLIESHTAPGVFKLTL